MALQLGHSPKLNWTTVKNEEIGKMILKQQL